MPYEYGYAWKEYPVDDIHVFPDGSMLGVQDIFAGVPDWMCAADLLFCDPPWNQGNLRSFYTKNAQDLEHSWDDFEKALFDAIGAIHPDTAYVEVGKEHLADFILRMRSLFPAVTFYNSMYYRRPENHCYIVRGARRSQKLKLDGLDEEQIIKWVCSNEEYECVADPCMGQGLVALYASRAGKKFVGTDMNPKRLAVARRRVENGKR